MIEDDDFRNLQFANILAELDEAVIHGRSRPTIEHDPELAQRLTDAEECLTLLEKTWPRQKKETTDFSSHPQSSLPEKIGNYTIVRELGRGGQGVVLLAFDARLRRHVAIKVPYPAYLLNPDSHRRFLREAEIIGRLDHPNLVRIFEFGEEHPIVFLVTSYCAGPNLSEWLRNQISPVPVEDALRLVISLSDAVAYLHSQDVLHRDIKPSNVLLHLPADSAIEGDLIACDLNRPLADFSPRLSDFGLAKILDQSNFKTRTHVKLGTPRYMAPEQADPRFGPISTATDIHALGLILYELLTNRLPYENDNEAEIYHQIANAEPISILKYRPDLPRDIDYICRVCLNKNPNQRYSTATALAADLQAVLDCRAIQAPKAYLSSPIQKIIPRLFATSAVAVLIIAMVLIAFKNKIGSKDHETTLASHGSETIRTNRNETESMALLGRQLTYADRIQKATNEWNELRLFSLPTILDQYKDESSQNELCGFEWHFLNRYRSQIQIAESIIKPIEKLAFSGVGNQLFVLDNSQTSNTLNSSTNKYVAQEKFCSISDCRMTPDGCRILSIEKMQNGLKFVVRNRDNGNIVSEWTNQNSILTKALLSPNGQYVVCITADANDKQDIRIRDLKLNTETSLHAKDDVGINAIQFSSDSQSLALSFNQRVPAKEDLLIEVFDTSTGKLRFPALKGHQHFIFALAFSPDCKTLFSGSSDETIKIWDMKIGKLLFNVPFQRGAIIALALSPDGMTAAFISLNFRTKIASLSLLDIKSRSFQYDVIRFGSSYPKLNESIVFSPDGSKILCGCDDGIVRIWNLKNLLAEDTFKSTSPREAWSVDFSPDHQSLLVGYDDEKGNDLSVLQIWNLKSRQVEKTLIQHQGMVFRAVYSPDGKTIASASHDHTIKIWDRQTGQVLHTLKGHDDAVRCLAFSPDGSKLLSGSKDHSIILWDLTKQSMIVTIIREDDWISHIGFTTDGSKFLIPHKEEIRIYDSKTGERQSSIVEIDSPGAFTVLPDGKTLICANSNFGMKLWDIETGKEIAIFRGHTDQIWTVTCSKDGKTIASGGKDGTIRLWQAATGRELIKINNIPSFIHSLAFSSDGRMLAAALEDGTVKIWNANNNDRMQN